MGYPIGIELEDDDSANGSISCISALSIAMSDASMNTWNGHVQSGGCTAGVGVSMAFKAM